MERCRQAAGECVCVSLSVSPCGVCVPCWDGSERRRLRRVCGVMPRSMPLLDVEGPRPNRVQASSIELDSNAPPPHAPTSTKKESERKDQGGLHRIASIGGVLIESKQSLNADVPRSAPRQRRQETSRSPAARERSLTLRPIRSSLRVPQRSLIIRAHIGGCTECSASQNAVL